MKVGASILTFIASSAFLAFAYPAHNSGTTDTQPICRSHIYDSNGTGPVFLFDKLANGVYTRAQLADTLFRHFKMQEIRSGMTSVNDTGDRYFLEFTAFFDPDGPKGQVPRKKNLFIFERTHRGNFILANAEVNFNTSKTPNRENSDLFKTIVLNPLLIDIGTTKEEIAKKYAGINETICDTLEVADDSQSIWFYFKSNKVTKISTDLYGLD